ncbi:MAG: hypothetical protein JNK23_05375 [Opitutaceae bacterium]|nr:hypothetical protein [Opitutaceae bacterium]
MKSAKSWLIVLLALTTACGGFVAWRQHGEIAALRSAAMPRDERAEFQKRVWDLEKANRELKNQAAARREGEAGGGNASPGSPAARGGGTAGNVNKADQKFDTMRDLVAKPEVQALIHLQQRGVIESRYAALFRHLNLPPDQVAKLTALLAERTASLLDVSAVARDQGVDPRSNVAGFQQLVASTQEEINRSIKGLIGEAGFAQLTGYEQTLAQRNTVSELQQRLSYTAAPLTNAQAEKLAQILASNPLALPANPSTTPKPAARPTDLNAALGTLLAGGADGGRATSLISPAALTQAQGVLSPPQLTALQQLQQQQQAQMQLRKLVAETFTPAPPSPAGPDGKR